MTPSKFRQDLWHRKIIGHVLSSGVVCVILREAFFGRNPTGVGQIDRQTVDGHRATVYTMIA